MSVLIVAGCTTTHVSSPKGWEEEARSFPLPPIRLAVKQVASECRSRFRDHSTAEALGGVLVAAKVMVDRSANAGPMRLRNKAMVMADLDAWYTSTVIQLDRGGRLPDHYLLEPVFCHEDMGRMFIDSARATLRPILYDGPDADYLLRIQVMRDDVAKSWTGGKAFSVASLPVGIGLFFLGLWADHFEHTVEVKVELLKGLERAPVLRRSYMITVEGAISNMMDEDAVDDMERMLTFVLGSFVSNLAEDVSRALARSETVTP